MNPRSNGRIIRKINQGRRLGARERPVAAARGRAGGRARAGAKAGARIKIGARFVTLVEEENTLRRKNVQKKKKGIGPTGTETLPRKAPEIISKATPKLPQNGLKNVSGSKKRAKEPQGSSKTKKAGANQAFLVDLEAPKSPQYIPKSSEKEPKRAPTRFQN